jgi:hypothetical protein
MLRLNQLWPSVLLLSLVIQGCQDLAPRDAPSPFIPRFQRSEIFRIPALATTLQWKAIMDIFQILWDLATT